MLEQGIMIGHYRLLDRVGNGSTGTVWKARDQVLNRIVAIKILHPELGADARYVERYREEARLGGKLRHSGIACIYSFEQFQGVSVIVQEFVGEGATLGSYLDEMRQEEPLPMGYFETIAEFFAEIADALQYAHRQGIQHGDIKPSNILLSGKFEPKIIDFGLARTEVYKDNSLINRFPGTVAYMSPEQLMQEGPTHNLGSDQYSLGVSLYEALALKRPFVAENEHRLIEEIIKGNPIDVDRVGDSVPKPLALICMKSIARNPAKRYKRIGDLRKDLLNYLEGKAIAARPKNTIEAALFFMKNHQKQLSVYLAAALLISVTAIAVVLHLGQVNRIRNAEALVSRHKHASDMLAMSTAGKTLSYEVVSEVFSTMDSSNKGWETGFLKQEIENEVIDAHSDSVCDLLYLEGGDRLLSSGKDGSVRLWDLASGKEIGEFAGHREEVRAIAVNSDESRLLTASGDRTLRVWNLLNGDLQLELFGHENAVETADVSSDGHWAVSGGDDPDVIVWDLENGGRPHTLLREHEGGVLAVAFKPHSSEVISIDNRGWIHRWDCETGYRIIMKRIDFVKKPSALALSANGKWIAVGSITGEIKIIDVEKITTTKRSKRIFNEQFSDGKARMHRITDLAFSKDGGLLASSGDEGAVYIWDLRGTGERIPSPVQVVDHTLDMNAIAFHPSGQEVASGFSSGLVTTWKLSDNDNLVALEEGASKAPVEIASHRGGCFALAARLTELLVWDIKTGDLYMTKKFYESSISSIAMDRHEKQVIVALQSGRMDLLNLDTKESKCILASHRSPILSLAWSPNEELFISGHRDSSVSVWNAKDFDLVARLPIGETAIRSLAFHPKSALFSLGTESGLVQTWDIERAEPLESYHGHTESISSIAFSNKSNLFASGDSGGKIVVWDPDSPPNPYEVSGHSGAVNSLTFSPDDERLVSGASDYRVVVWDYIINRRLLNLREHEASVLCVAFTPNGESLISMASDLTSRTWIGGD